MDTILEKINNLKQKHNAVILAHNYQTGDIQDIADFAGDSLGLSIQASKTDADVIVFCGVLFMAETAAILSPDKIVLLPDKYAGCPMADMITAAELRKLKQKHPDALVVCYVNSSAEVKAESDYCCTSANAVEVVNSLPKDKKIIFVPDKNLGQYTAQKTSRDLILWPGYCPSHVVISEKDIKKAKEEHPDAIVMAHPECPQSVKAVSDQLLSTGQMLKFAKTSSIRKFIIATETGIIHTLKKENPDAEFIPATQKALCPNMKKITMEKILWALEDLENSSGEQSSYRITVPDDIREKAKKSLDRMIEILPEN
ncbi:MAG: quinolinate synthase NadA [Sedimentisphaerales bacterium]|nr:quinolinate synthase NadA [Sedimentisphaerales bacterium]